MSNSPPPISLTYVSSQERTASELQHKLCLFCGIAPLSVGLSILLLFWLTEWDTLPMLGLLTLIGGGTAVVFGLVLNLVYLVQARGATVNRSESLRRGTVSLVVLLLNIPTAVFCAWAGTGLIFSPGVHFVIENRGTSPIAGGTIFHANRVATFGPIPPGGSTKAYLRIDAGPVYCEFKRNGSVTKTEVSSYVDGDSYRAGSKCTIKIDDAGARQVNY